MITFIQCAKIHTLFQNTNSLNNIYFKKLLLKITQIQNTFLMSEIQVQSHEKYQVILVMTSTTHFLSLKNG